MLEGDQALDKKGSSTAESLCRRPCAALTGFDCGEGLRRNAPDPIAVSVIGRLAVSCDYAGQGLGADLLADALRRIAVASPSIGIAAVLVHAKSDAAKGFYLACAEFIEHPADSRILFLPIEAVVASIR